MERHNENGLAVAVFLADRGLQVVYPGLEQHPQYDLASRQMSGFSGMVAVELGDPARARTLAAGTRVFQLAESLGGVQSLISVPALQTHASVPQEVREALGITEGLVRLSVGIEDVKDLIQDLGQALP